jgi:MYXO-CTERM domain-containing protein
MLLKPLQIVFAASAVAAVLGPIDVARACSLPSCGPPIVIPTTSYIPGNLVYFEVAVDAPGPMTLRTAEGDPIPASLRTIGHDRVFAPDAPIPPGTAVVLEYALFCHGDEAPPNGTFEFWTVADSSIELQPARLYMDEYGIAHPGVEHDEVAFVRLGMTSPDLNNSATHLMSHRVTVDGQSVRGWVTPGALTPVEINTDCRPQQAEMEISSCGTLESVPAGPHTVAVQTRVLGYDGVIAPVTFEIETRCPEAGVGLLPPLPIPAPVDAGSPIEAPVNGTDSPPDTTTPSVAAPVSMPSPSDSGSSSEVGDAGCALRAGTESSSTSGGLALLALALVGWRRRSR